MNFLSELETFSKNTQYTTGINLKAEGQTLDALLSSIVGNDDTIKDDLLAQLHVIDETMPLPFRDRATFQKLWLDSIQTGSSESLEKTLDEISESVLSASRKKQLLKTFQFEESLTQWENETDAFLIESPETDSFEIDHEDRQLAAEKIRMCYYNNPTAEQLRKEDTVGMEEWEVDNAGGYFEPTKLILSGLKLSSLPDALGLIDHLESLDISSNRLTEMPDFISRLVNLETLYLYHNDLKDIPKVLSKLPKLRNLSFGGKAVTDLSSEICSLSRLQELFINYTQIKELPAEITQLKQLKVLDVSHNRLQELPQNIGELSSLKALNLDNNKDLSILPDTATRLDLKDFSYENTSVPEEPIHFLSISAER